MALTRQLKPTAEQKYILECRDVSWTNQWRPVPIEDVLHCGRDERRPDMWTFEFKHWCPVYLITGSMLRLLDPWFFQGSDVVRYELCAAWIKKDYGGWKALFHSQPGVTQFLRDKTV